jgi:hypothetical protein
VAGDEPTLSADHRRRFDDQHDLAETVTSDRAAEHREDRAIGWREPRAGNLALEHTELVAQREDLGILIVGATEQQHEPSKHRLDQREHDLRHSHRTLRHDHTRRVSGTFSGSAHGTNVAGRVRKARSI